jgi:type VI protein secretion system component Hcp
MIRKRLNYANVMSTVSVFIVLGGSAYAAASITGKNVRDGSLTGADIKDHTLRSIDFKLGELPTGPAGPQGERGADGAAGRDGAPGAGQAEPPPQIPPPVGRLTLAGVTGSGPGGTIEVRSVAWSNVITNYEVTGGGVGPTLTWGDIAITKAPDRTSPELWKRTATGLHSTSAKLELLAAGAAAPYATYTLADVTVKRFSTRGSGDERLDTVQLGFNTAMAANPGLTFDPTAPLTPAAEPRVGQMTLDGIAGETDVVLDAWSVSNPDGTAKFGPFVVSAAIGPASPMLLKRFANAQHTKSVTIKLLQPGSTDTYSTYVLTDVVISSLALTGDGRPLERIGLDAAKIESTTPVSGGEPIRACFDRKLIATC